MGTGFHDAAIVQNGDKNTQVQIGTLVRVGQTWKTIDPPVISGEGQPEAAAAGFFSADSGNFIFLKKSTLRSITLEQIAIATVDPATKA